MKIKNILFRADSSSDIGIGHIMRDLVLAKQFKKDNVCFATRNLKGNINDVIIENGFSLNILHTNENEELFALIEKLEIDLVVIDHYEIDYDYEKQLKIKYPNLKIMVLDDTYERHCCDILLNHNISADKYKYKELVPEYCELRCGSKYTLLREEFIIEKKNIIKKNISKVKTIFIAMGGADHSNINLRILDVLKEFDNIRAIVVTTTANKNLKTLEEYVKNEEWIKLHVNSKKIAHLMNISDFAIVSPSVTVNEVFFMELPFIAIRTAGNQQDMYEFLAKKKLSLKLFHALKLKKIIGAYLNG